VAVVILCTFCEKLGDPYQVQIKVTPFKIVFHCKGCNSRSDDVIQEYSGENLD
jgi:hypothetical protein